MAPQFLPKDGSATQQGTRYEHARARLETYGNGVPNSQWVWDGGWSAHDVCQSHRLDSATATLASARERSDPANR